MPIEITRRGTRLAALPVLFMALVGLFLGCGGGGGGGVEEELPVLDLGLLSATQVSRSGRTFTNPFGTLATVSATPVAGPLYFDPASFPATVASRSGVTLPIVFEPEGPGAVSAVLGLRFTAGTQVVERFFEVVATGEPVPWDARAHDRRLRRRAPRREQRAGAPLHQRQHAEPRDAQHRERPVRLHDRSVPVSDDRGSGRDRRDHRRPRAARAWNLRRSPSHRRGRPRRTRRLHGRGPADRLRGEGHRPRYADPRERRDAGAHRRGPGRRDQRLHRRADVRERRGRSALVRRSRRQGLRERGVHGSAQVDRVARHLLRAPPQLRPRDHTARPRRRDVRLQALPPQRDRDHDGRARASRAPRLRRGAPRRSFPSTSSWLPGSRRRRPAPPETRTCRRC